MTEIKIRSLVDWAGDLYIKKDDIVLWLISIENEFKKKGKVDTDIAANVIELLRTQFEEIK